MMPLSVGCSVLSGEREAVRLVTACSSAAVCIRRVVVEGVVETKPVVKIDINLNFFK